MYKYVYILPYRKESDQIKKNYEAIMSYAMPRLSDTDMDPRSERIYFICTAIFRWLNDLSCAAFCIEKIFTMKLESQYQHLFFWHTANHFLFKPRISRMLSIFFRSVMSLVHFWKISIPSFLPRYVLKM